MFKKLHTYSAGLFMVLSLIGSQSYANGTQAIANTAISSAISNLNSYSDSSSQNRDVWDNISYTENRPNSSFQSQIDQNFTDLNNQLDTNLALTNSNIETAKQEAISAAAINSDLKDDVLRNEARATAELLAQIEASGAKDYTDDLVNSLKLSGGNGDSGSSSSDYVVLCNNCRGSTKTFSQDVTAYKNIHISFEHSDGDHGEEIATFTMLNPHAIGCTDESTYQDGSIRISCSGNSIGVRVRYADHVQLEKVIAY